MQAFENRDGQWGQHVAAAAHVFATEISAALVAQGVGTGAASST
jgi:hypothetical protein